MILHAAIPSANSALVSAVLADGLAHRPESGGRYE